MQCDAMAAEPRSRIPAHCLGSKSSAELIRGMDKSFGTLFPFVIDRVIKTILMLSKPLLLVLRRICLSNFS